MRIRLMNPHAQSKDPCALIRAQPSQGVLSALLVWSGHSCPLLLTLILTLQDRGPGNTVEERRFSAA